MAGGQGTRGVVPTGTSSAILVACLLVACLAAPPGPGSPIPRAGVRAAFCLQREGQGGRSPAALELGEGATQYRAREGSGLLLPTAEGGGDGRWFLFRGGLTVSVREAGFEAGGIGGASTFDSATGLSAWLVEHPEEVRGRECLELGAGTGLVGCVCAHLGAASVCLTDVDSVEVFGAGAGPALLDNLAANVRENSESMLSRGASRKITCQKLDWNDAVSSPSAQPEGVSSQYDVIVGSDLHYSRASVKPLCATVKKYLRPGGRFISLSPQGRAGEEELLSGMRDLGSVDLTEYELEQCEVRSEGDAGEGDQGVFCLPCSTQSVHAVRELAESCSESVRHQILDALKGDMGLKLRQKVTLLTMVLGDQDEGARPASA